MGIRKNKHKTGIERKERKGEEEPLIDEEAKKAVKIPAKPLNTPTTSHLV